MTARRSELGVRILVFIDGQNVYKRCRDLFGQGYCHPLLLAHRVAKGRRLVGVRFYSGMHDPHVDPTQNAVAERRHALMRRLGVTVVSRKLRYRWEWGFDQSKLPNPREHQGEQRVVEVRPFRRSREKGIDLALGLDVVDLATRGLMDVAVIVSTDTDLTEVARAVHAMTRSRGRVSVEAAVFNVRRKPMLLADYDYTHQLGRNDFEETRDSFNYRKPLDRPMQEAFLVSCEQYRVARG